MLSYVVEQEFIAIKRWTRYVDQEGAVHYHDSIGADITGMFEDRKVYSHLTVDQISDWLKIDDLAMLEFITADNLFNAVCEGILRRSVEKQGLNWLDMVKDPDCNSEWFFGQRIFSGDAFAKKYQAPLESALAECAKIVTDIFILNPLLQDLIIDAEMLLSVLNYATVTPDQDQLAVALFENESIRTLLTTPEHIAQAHEYAPRVVECYFGEVEPESEPVPSPSAASAAATSSPRLWQSRPQPPADGGYARLAADKAEADRAEADRTAEPPASGGTPCCHCTSM
ncbi:MAG: hypothetical protein P1U34_02000 [Coxiellaceae bacterium]|nr:hypothetical protein [Coxiellaceae bacterium]